MEHKQSFFTTIESMPENVFQKHFRFCRCVINNLISDVYADLPYLSIGRRGLTNMQKGIISLWYLANSCPSILVAEQVGIFQATVFEIVTQFLKSAIRVFSPTVSLPLTADPATTIPGCIGYMDGTHIELIKRPRVEPNLYYDRHQNWSVNVLAVVKHNMEFVYSYIGAFGSAHNKREYQCNNLLERLSGLSADLLILGDSAYPATTRLLPPYPNPIEPQQLAFNKIHRAQPVKVENAFSQLKGRWRRLKNLDVNSIDRAKLVIKACMLIHNYSIRARGGQPPQPVNVVPPADAIVEVNSTPAGIAKRNQIAGLL